MKRNEKRVENRLPITQLIETYQFTRDEGYRAKVDMDVFLFFNQRSGDFLL